MYNKKGIFGLAIGLIILIGISRSIIQNNFEKTQSDITKEGKEIQLSPDKILLTNNQGTYIELSDAEGIKMVSEGTVSIRANGIMFITSQNSSIELSATDKIRLKQGETEMKLGGDLYLTGAQVKL